MIEIRAELKRLSGLMRDLDYVPHTKLVLHDVEEEKVFHLCHYSEKLAIALGLINTAPGTPLRIRKNLWVCEDCHSSTKFISKIVGRAIMLRMQITLVTLRMVFVFAWTIGNASTLSSQSLYEFHFFCSMP